jgi:hypothetical protein
MKGGVYVWVCPSDMGIYDVVSLQKREKKILRSDIAEKDREDGERRVS